MSALLPSNIDQDVSRTMQHLSSRVAVALVLLLTFAVVAQESSRQIESEAEQEDEFSSSSSQDDNSGYMPQLAGNGSTPSQELDIGDQPITNNTRSIINGTGPIGNGTWPVLNGTASIVNGAVEELNVTISNGNSTSMIGVRPKQPVLLGPPSSTRRPAYPSKRPATSSKRPPIISRPPNNGTVVTNKCGQYTPRGRGGPGYRIAGGYPASQGEFPSYVKLSIMFGGEETLCGGAIISDRLIVSAAHCFSHPGMNVYRIEALVGSVGGFGGQKYMANQYCVPNEFQRDRSEYDLALVVTKKAIQFNNRVQAACLPSSETKSKQQAWVVGFGLTSNSGFNAQPSSSLQVLPVTRDVGGCYQYSGQNSVCFKSNDPSRRGAPCQGDSGGPVYAIVNNRQTVLAAVSRGPNQCQAGVSETDIYMDLYRMRTILNQLPKTCRRL